MTTQDRFSIPFAALSTAEVKPVLAIWVGSRRVQREFPLSHYRNMSVVSEFYKRDARQDGRGAGPVS